MPGPVGRPPADPQRRLVAFHEPVHGDRRTIDVGAAGPDCQRHLTQHNAEQRGEDLRLAYVALTRARHQAVALVGGLVRQPPLRARAPAVRARRRRLRLAAPADADRRRRRGAADELAAAVPGCIGVEVTGVPSGRRALEPAATGGGAADRGPLRPRIDASWRRTSYSDITADAHDAIVASEPEEGVVADEPRRRAGPTPSRRGGTRAARRRPATPRAARAVPSLLAAMPVGVDVGTFVHRVLQAADFAAPDLDAELYARVVELQARRRVEIGDPGLVAAGLAGGAAHAARPAARRPAAVRRRARRPPRRARVRAAARGRRAAATAAG